MKDMAASITLEAWQIYGTLFVAFWLSSAYFNNFFTSVVLCFIWGGLAEIVTNYMFRLGKYRPAKLSNGEVSSLMTLAGKEASLVPSLTNMAKLEVSRNISPGAPMDEKEEDVHYVVDPDNIIDRLGSVSNKLEQYSIKG